MFRLQGYTILGVHIMACFSTTLRVLNLLGFIALSANQETCDPAAVGQKKLTLPFVKKPLSATDALKWTHNGTIIFHKQSGKVSIGKPEDVTATGDLQLYDLKFSDAGVYKADVHDHNGTLVKGLTTRLCVIAPQPKPVVTFACDSKANVVTLTCNVPQAQGLIFAWALNGKPLPSETSQTLKSSLKGVKNNDYACSAANKVGKESSVGIQPTCPPEPPTCSPPPQPPPTLLCFKRNIVLVTLAGAGSAILLLIVVIIALCLQRRRRAAALSRGDRGQVQMSQLTPPDPVGHDYESMHHPTSPSPGPKASPMYSTGGSPPPTPDASRRGAYTLAVPQPGPGAQASEKTPEVSTAAEGQKHSPVPKPRTKAPQTTGN